MLWSAKEPYNTALHWERNQCWKTSQCSSLHLQHSDPTMRKLANRMCAHSFFRNHTDACLIFRIYFFFLQYLRYFRQLKAKSPNPALLVIISQKKRYQKTNVLNRFFGTSIQCTRTPASQKVWQKYFIKVFVGITKTLEVLQITICLSFSKTTFFALNRSRMLRKT